VHAASRPRRTFMHFFFSQTISPRRRVRDQDSIVQVHTTCRQLRVQSCFMGDGDAAMKRTESSDRMRNRKRGGGGGETMSTVRIQIAPNFDRHASDDMQACHLTARHLRMWRTNVQKSTVPYLPTARSFQTRESNATSQSNATSGCDALQSAARGHLVLDGERQKLLQISASACQVRYRVVQPPISRIS
jgi:hypothetical protein